LDEALIRIITKNLDLAEEILAFLKRAYPLSFETGRSFCKFGAYKGFYRVYLTVVKNEGGIATD